MNCECDQEDGLTWLQIRIILLIGLLFCLGLAEHWADLNGIERLTKWEWLWQDRKFSHTALYLLPFFVLIYWVLWRIKEGFKGKAWKLIALLMLASFMLQISSKLLDYRGIDLIREIIASPSATGYYTDALAIQGNLSDWMRHFHEAALKPHSSTHPPGPILFYYLFLQLIGQSSAAFIGGVFIALITSAGVAVMWHFSRLWTDDAKARLTACACYTLMPAMVVFYPEFDQIYPILSMLLMLFWANMLRIPDKTWTYAAATGAVLFITSFFAYNLLALNAFFLYFSLYWLWKNKWQAASFLRLTVCSIAVITTLAALHAALWLFVGYRPIDSFLHALSEQLHTSAMLNRSYRIFIFFDLYDFLLGAGIIIAPIIVLHALRTWKNKDQESHRALALIALATILTIDFSGLLRGETARVWLFLQPLLAAPAGVALSRLQWNKAVLILALQCLIMTTMMTNMIFIAP